MGAIRHALRRRDAESFLRRSGAASLSGCLMNPNARCPRCSAPVFYYANAFGSRVFFDDLGPPWPKHPCTDTAGAAITCSPVPTPTRRHRGIAQELVEAANTAGLLRKSFGQRDQREWALCVVIATSFRGRDHRLDVEYLDSANGEKASVAYRSDKPILVTGDFVSLRRDEFSFMDVETLQPVTFRFGSEIRPLQPPSDPERCAIKLAIAGPVRSAEGEMTRMVGKEMTAEEMVHYHSDHEDVAAFCQRLRPIIAAYDTAGVRNDQTIAEKLNGVGHRTAADALWTPRRVRFLLQLLRARSHSPRTIFVQNAARPPISKHRSGRMQTLHEIAEKLSKTGQCHCQAAIIRRMTEQVDLQAHAGRRSS